MYSHEKWSAATVQKVEQKQWKWKQIFCCVEYEREYNLYLLRVLLDILYQALSLTLSVHGFICQLSNCLCDFIDLANFDIF